MSQLMINVGKILWALWNGCWCIYYAQCGFWILCTI